MSDIKYVRLEKEELTTAQEVAEHHASTMAAAIRFIIRDWKRLSRDEQDWIEVVRNVPND